MNRFVKKELKKIRDSCNAVEAYLNARDEPEEEEPTEEETPQEELDRHIDEARDFVNWSKADEPEPAGTYLKDLKYLTTLKGLTIVGQVKSVFDLKSYVGTDKEGNQYPGLIYRIVLSDDTGGVTVVAFDEMATKLKEYPVGTFLKFTNCWRMKENKHKVMELHIGNFAKIEVVE